MENFDGALRQFQIANKQNVLGAEHYYWGMEYYNSDEFIKSAENFSRALEGEFPFVAYFLRGRTYAARNDLDIAIGDFSRMIDIKPNYAPVYRFRASLYERKGDKYHARLDRQQAEKLADK